MIFDDYKPKRKKFGGKTLYFVLAMGIIAAGAGAWSALSPEMGSDMLVPETVTEEQYTIDWNGWDGEELQTQEEKANAPITGIPDERDDEEDDEFENGVLSATDALESTEDKGFFMPMGVEVVKDYSNDEMVKSKTMGDWRVHNGVDFKGSVGDSVYAIQAGTVTKVYSDELWGVVTEIDHGGGLTAIYCGLSDGSTKSIGNKVNKGEIIAKLGEIPSEQADGYHLHFEVKINGKTVDPLKTLAN